MYTRYATPYKTLPQCAGHSDLCVAACSEAMFVCQMLLKEQWSVEEFSVWYGARLRLAAVRFLGSVLCVYYVFYGVLCFLKTEASFFQDSNSGSRLTYETMRAVGLEELNSFTTQDNVCLKSASKSHANLNDRKRFISTYHVAPKTTCVIPVCPCWLVSHMARW